MHSRTSQWNLALVLATALCFGCVSVRTSSVTADAGAGASDTTASDAAPAQLSNAVHWTRNSAERKALFLQTYRLAGERVAELTAKLEPGTWAVALDADETVIDNSQYQKELEQSGRTFNPQSWADWVERRQASPLPGAVVFLEGVRERGGKIAIVTNRAEALCPATEDNFERYGIPFDVILCRPPETSEKERRWQQIEEGTTPSDLPPVQIVMWIGDNITDFPDLDQKIHAEPDGAFDDFGRRYIVVPNPMYGSFASNPRN